MRQHAQTVHVNENIPLDSLAASGSRFPRQIRTERVRQQAGNRARASTAGSAGGPVRGHSKSLSTSSINSISSVGSSYSAQTDARRRPAPLVMADPRSRHSLESYRTADSTYSSYRPPSPGDFSTPTSATFSTGQTSPRWSGVASPTMSHSRNHSMYSAGTRTPGRRLSVPSGVNPFQSPQGHPMGRPLFGPGSLNASNVGAFSPSNGGMVSSPTASNWSRRDSMSSNPDEAWRRRTWHPDSRSINGNSSQLSTVVNQSSVRPNPPPPMANPSQAQSNLRLPGIESFDPVPQRPVTPPRRIHSPMMVDSEPPARPVLHPSLTDTPHQEERRNLNIYDASLQRGIGRLDINHGTPPRDSAGAWASEANKAVQAQAEQVRMNQPTVRFEDQQIPSYQPMNPVMASRAFHQHTMSAPITTSRDAKRHGWYHGPVAPPRDARPAPQQDPRGPHVDRMVHPNFTGFSGFPSREQAPPQQQQPHERPQNADHLRRLEALVAVATSEGSTAAAY